MRRIVRVAMAASLSASVLVAAGSGPAAAAPPTVSATEGVPGTRIEVSIPGCNAESDESFSFTQALLISGVAPDAVLAGAGSSDVGAAVLVVPDWVDADAPAVIQAACLTFDFSAEDFATTAVPADPVAFDVLPGGPATQTRTFSRTSLLVGQGFSVSGQGCNLPGATAASVDVVMGNDRSGVEAEDFVASGFAGLDGASFDVETVLTGDQGYGLGYSSNGVPGDEELDVDEFANDIEPGTYTAFPYCLDDDGTSLFYEPQIIEVTGRAAVDQIDLVADPESRNLTLAGRGCTAGTVAADFEGESLADLVAFDDPGDSQVAPDDGETGAEFRFGPSGNGADPTPTDPRGPMGDVNRDSPASPEGAATQVVGGDDGDFVSRTATPDGAGAWSIEDEAAFDRGFVAAFTICGDPLADGFVYDVQAAVVDVTPRPVPPPVAPTTPILSPPPADAVRGRPNFTG